MSSETLTRTEFAAKFKEWLSPLKEIASPNKQDSPLSPTKLRTDNEVSNLCDSFAEQLQLQDSEHDTKKKQNIERIITDIQDLLPRDAHKNFEDLRKMFAQLERAKASKSDVECSGSTWTVDKFLKYADKIKLEITFTLPTTLGDVSEVFDDAMFDVRQQGRILTGITDKVLLFIISLLLH